MKVSENTKKLIDAWLLHKYWESCCLDEAIDWCNHQGNYQLTPDEMEEFMAWRDAMKKIKNELSKHISYSSYNNLGEILYAL